eukprot:4026667-Amphidinium_carterae.1
MTFCLLSEGQGSKVSLALKFGHTATRMSIWLSTCELGRGRANEGSQRKCSSPGEMREASGLNIYFA